MPTDTPPTGEHLRAMFQAARRELGGLSYHTRDSRGSDVGFPDVVDLPRGGSVSYVEFKGRGERVTPEQRAWMDALVVAGERVYECRPANARSVAVALGLLPLLPRLVDLGCGDGPAAPGCLTGGVPVESEEDDDGLTTRQRAEMARLVTDGYGETAARRIVEQYP